MDCILISSKFPGKGSEDKGTNDPVVKEKLTVEAMWFLLELLTSAC